MRRAAVRLATWLLLFLWAIAAPARADGAPRLQPGEARRGIAVLSSSVGHDVSVDEIDAFVSTCRLDLVVVDFAWITYHWDRTDCAAVEDLAQRLGRRGVVVAAMYRPRLLHASDADVPVARDEKGAAAKDHVDVCLAAQASVDWGAAWGEKILRACPSIDHVALYNLRPTCACAACRDGGASRLAGEFVAACRERWTRTRPSVRVGHVGVGLELLRQLDFVWPFLAVNREDAAAPVDAERLASDAGALRKAAADTPLTPLAKV
jgi:hypothetical protein